MLPIKISNHIYYAVRRLLHFCTAYCCQVSSQAVRPCKSAPLANLATLQTCIGFCAFQDAKEAALEGTDDKVGTADKSNTVEVTAPSDSPSAKPEEVAEGEESPAVKAQANGSPPSKESSLPSDAPPEVGEGENPDAVGQEAGTLDESDTVEVSLSPAPSSVTPASNIRK